MSTKTLIKCRIITLVTLKSCFIAHKNIFSILLPADLAQIASMHAVYLNILTSTITCHTTPTTLVYWLALNVCTDNIKFLFSTFAILNTNLIINIYFISTKISLYHMDIIILKNKIVLVACLKDRCAVNILFLIRPFCTCLAPKMSAVLRTVMSAPVAKTAVQTVAKRSITSRGFNYGPPRYRISFVVSRQGRAIIKEIDTDGFLWILCVWWRWGEVLVYIFIYRFVGIDLHGFYMADLSGTSILGMNQNCLYAGLELSFVLTRVTHGARRGCNHYSGTSFHIWK